MTTSSTTNSPVIQSSPCIWRTLGCSTRCSMECKYKCFSATDDTFDLMIEKLRSTALKNGTSLKGKRLSRSTYNFSSFGVKYDTTQTLDQYYMCFINDVLKSIRKKQTSYIFKLDHIAEIMRFEPEVQIVLKEGIFHISLPVPVKAKCKV